MSKPKLTVHSYPVYVSDWRDSETRMRLNLAERGLLWELIFYAAKEGSLPVERDALVSIAGIRGRDFDRAWVKVRHCFVQVSGRLHHPKVDRTIEAMDDYRRKQRESGLNGAKARWQPHSDPISDPMPSAAAYTATTTYTAAAAASVVWPLAAAAIREPFPETGEGLIRNIVDTALRKDPDLSDEQIAYLATNAWKRKRAKQQGPGLFLTTILEEYERCRVKS